MAGSSNRAPGQLHQIIPLVAPFDQCKPHHSNIATIASPPTKCVKPIGPGSPRARLTNVTWNVQRLPRDTYGTPNEGVSTKSLISLARPRGIEPLFSP